jgi:hypothetical protein
MGRDVKQNKTNPKVCHGDELAVQLGTLPNPTRKKQVPRHTGGSQIGAPQLPP